MPELVSQPADQSPLRRDCRRCAVGLMAVSVMLSALAILDAVGPWAVHRPTLTQILVRLVELVAPAFYFASLWRLAFALRSYADSGRFIAASGQALTGVGLPLALGGAFETLLAPGLERMAGQSPGYWIGLDPAASAISALGVALLIVARLFRRAARMEAELEMIL